MKEEVFTRWIDPVIEEKDKEIERLNENNQAMQEEMVRTWEKLQQKENIIKEVRKYANKYNDKIQKDILEILDKESNNEENK